MIPTKDKESFGVTTLKAEDFCLKQLWKRNPHNPGATSVARAIAKAMADQGPPGETVLQRSFLLQVKLVFASQRITFI